MVTAPAQQLLCERTYSKNITACNYELLILQTGNAEKRAEGNTLGRWCKFCPLMKLVTLRFTSWVMASQYINFQGVMLRWETSGVSLLHFSQQLEVISESTEQIMGKSWHPNKNVVKMRWKKITSDILEFSPPCSFGSVFTHFQTEELLILLPQLRNDLIRHFTSFFNKRAEISKIGRQ